MSDSIGSTTKQEATIDDGLTRTAIMVAQSEIKLASIVRQGTFASHQSLVKYWSMVLRHIDYAIETRMRIKERISQYAYDRLERAADELISASLELISNADNHVRQP